MILVLVILILFINCWEIACGSPFDSIYNKTFQNYESEIPPNQIEDTPITVRIQVKIQSIRNVESQADFKFHIREKWTDNRLSILENVEFQNSSWAKNPNVSKPLPRKYRKNVWVIDNFFMKSSDVKTIETEEFVWTDPAGRLQLSRKYDAVVPCERDYYMFPFEKIVCPFEISSYKHTINDVIFQWEDKGVILTQKEVDDSTVHLTDSKPKTDVDIHDNGMGNFSIARARIVFQRKSGRFFLNTYFPAVLLVFLSWLGFWINRASTPARSCIYFTTVLTLLTLAKGYTTESAIKPICVRDLYIWICFAFVIAATLVFAISDYTLKSRSTSTDMLKLNFMVQNIDQVSRFIFPVAFLIFNIIYWVLIIAIS